MCVHEGRGVYVCMYVWERKCVGRDVYEGRCVREKVGGVRRQMCGCVHEKAGVCLRR